MRRFGVTSSTFNFIFHASSGFFVRRWSKCNFSYNLNFNVLAQYDSTSLGLWTQPCWHCQDFAQSRSQDRDQEQGKAFYNLSFLLLSISHFINQFLNSYFPVSPCFPNSSNFFPCLNQHAPYSVIAAIPAKVCLSFTPNSTYMLFHILCRIKCCTRLNSSHAHFRYFELGRN